MRKGKCLATLAVLALFLTQTTACLYAQRGRGGGNGGGTGVGGSGFPGNPGNTAGGIGFPNPPVTRPANNTPNPGIPDQKAQDKKAAESRTPQNKVADEIGKNPGTQKSVERLLPITMNLDEASSGFKNRGQFIAALHASKNLEIPFTDLKSRMTGNDAMSLGKTIHSLKPDLSDDQVEAETKKAEKQAKETEKVP